MKTNKILSLVVLAVMGAMSVGCSNADDPIISGGEEVTLTATISLEGGEAQTRALDAQGRKTFAVGDQIAVVYENAGGKMQKAVTDSLTADDIADDGKKATITVTLTDPKADGTLKYIYPAAMANNDGSVNYDKLKKQDGTLASLAANLDVALYEGSLFGEELPADVILTNLLCIGVFSIMNDDNDITGNIRMMTVFDGTNLYIVNREPAAGPIYVAMQPTDGDKALQFYTTDGTTNYRKSVSGKTLEPGNMYPVNLTMPTDKRTALELLTGDYTVKDGETLTGILLGNYSIKTDLSDVTVTLDGVDINSTYRISSEGIRCSRNTTLILADGSDNKVVSGTNGYAGISIGSNYTVTIRGNGSLTAVGKSSSNIGGAGIGGTMSSTGNIVIESGNITAEGGKYSAGIGCGFKSSDPSNFGDITISGGNVTAKGGHYAAGIGTGMCSSKDYVVNTYGSIYITTGVTWVTAVVTSTSDCNSIGTGKGASSGNVIIGCTLDSEGNPVGGEEGMIKTSPYTFQP